MTVITSVEAFAPATSANLGVGFDILGLALEGMGDCVIAARSQDPGVRITSITGDDGQIPREVERNTAGIAALALLQQCGITGYGVELTIHKGLPLASGLGGSAASAVAAAVAVNNLLGEPLSRDELLPICMEGEALISGYHADNIAPSLYGGITLIVGTDADSIRRLPVPERLCFALVTPDVRVPTAEARAVLPAQVSLKHMISQTANVALLVDSLYRGNVAGVAAAMAGDVVVEPARAHLMPHMTQVREAAIHAGALSVVISGAGPTLCAVCDSMTTAPTAAQAMKNVYDSNRIASQVHVSSVDQRGAYVMNQRTAAQEVDLS